MGFQKDKFEKFKKNNKDLHWEKAEKLFALSLIYNGKDFQQEIMDRPQGVGKVGKGECDFYIYDDPDYMIEVKTRISEKSVGFPGAKDHHEIKRHQMIALREGHILGKRTGFLIGFWFDDKELETEYYYIPFEKVIELVIKKYRGVTLKRARNECMRVNVININFNGEDIDVLDLKEVLK
jgi:hypothetical protein